MTTIAPVASQRQALPERRSPARSHAAVARFALTASRITFTEAQALIQRAFVARCGGAVASFVAQCQGGAA